MLARVPIEPLLSVLQFKNIQFAPQAYFAEISLLSEAYKNIDRKTGGVKRNIN